jgi:hypothetical protein
MSEALNYCRFLEVLSTPKISTDELAGFLAPLSLAIKSLSTLSRARNYMPSFDSWLALAFSLAALPHAAS